MFVYHRLHSVHIAYTVDVMIVERQFVDHTVVQTQTADENGRIAYARHRYHLAEIRHSRIVHCRIGEYGTHRQRLVTHKIYLLIRDAHKHLFHKHPVERRHTVAALRDDEIVGSSERFGNIAQRTVRQHMVLLDRTRSVDYDDVNPRRYVSVLETVVHNDQFDVGMFGLNTAYSLCTLLAHDDHDIGILELYLQRFIAHVAIGIVQRNFTIPPRTTTVSARQKRNLAFLRHISDNHLGCRRLSRSADGYVSDAYDRNIERLARKHTRIEEEMPKTHSRLVKTSCYFFQEIRHREKLFFKDSTIFNENKTTTAEYYPKKTKAMQFYCLSVFLHTFAYTETIYNMKKTHIITIVAVAIAAFACKTSTQRNADEETQRTVVFGIEADDYDLERNEIRNGQTLSDILHGYGISPATVDRLDRASRNVFPLRNIRKGNSYTAFVKRDSLSSQLDYLVYERSITEYVVFGFVGDSVFVTTGERPVTLQRTKCSAEIESSLWGAIIKEGLPYSLAAELEDIYQWTVDFFGVQKGDAFTVIYDEKFVDTLSVGVGRIWGAKFTHGGKDIYAIPFKSNDKVRYWEYDGGSLRKQMLKAPLKFTRISSKFSNSRFHPVLKRYRPHHGVDYAAPKGTPVRAVADGVVTFKGWGGGGGNTIKIKHPRNMMTGYLHLSKFAAGLTQGKHVSQGEVIGYVGSTGTSTGPHLDFRVWKNGKPIDPLKIPQEPSEPIADADREAFEFVRDRIVAELNGEVPDAERITQLDSIKVVKNIENSADAAATDSSAQPAETR